MTFNKKGAQNMAVIVLGSILLIYLIAFFVLAGTNSWDFGQASSTISDFSMNVLKPLFNFVLNLDAGDGTNNFLIILTFILLAVIVTGTLDSFNIFSGSNFNNGVLNLVIGVIVSIIGVRFMPPNIWASLTAPSSALVATVLVGIPFGAFFFMSMKVRSFLARKILWLFYIVFLSYLIFSRPESYVSPSGATGFFQGFALVYLIFLVLAAIMLFFDGTARALFYKEKASVEMSEMIAKLNLKQRYKLRREIEEYNNILGDSSATDADKLAAKNKLLKLEKLYGNLSVI